MTTSRRLWPLPLLLIGMAALAVLVLNPRVVQAQSQTTDQASVVWSADMLVVEYTENSIGAASAYLFSNIGGTGDLGIRSLWSHVPNRDLRLAFQEGFPDADDLTLIVGDLTLEFPPGSSGNGSFKWTNVDVDWEDGQTISVSIVLTSALQTPAANTPATGAPIISGTAQVDKTLTAETSSIADEDGLDGASYSYQWSRSDGSTYADLAGETASTYALLFADQGKTIKVRVSFTDNADNEETLTSEATVEVAAAPNRAATGAPTINGTAQVGETLTADTSAIADEDGLDDVSYSYQWIRSDNGADTDIAGETDSTYTVVLADQGKTIKVKVTFTDDRNNAETLTSVATEAVAAAPNSSATGLPTISGTAQVDETLTAETSSIADEDGLDDVSYSYQWIRNDGNSDTDIVDATDVAYTLTDDDFGRTTKVRVTFTDDRGNAETLTSEATGAVAAAPNSDATGIPTISGTAQVDETLTAETSSIADEDGLDDVDYSYQWTANDVNGDTDIAGATGSIYTPLISDVGKTLKVRVSFTDDRNNKETLTSEATATVAATVSGAPQNVQVSPVGASQALDVTWEAPASDGGSAVTGYKVQWKSGEEDYDASREATVSVRPFLLWWHRITGLTNGSVYTIRVIATNSAGGRLPSTEVSDTPLSDPDRLRRFIAVDVVEAHESSHPWLRTTWDYMKSGVELRVHYSSNPSGQVSTVCSYDDGLQKCRSEYMTIAERSVDSLGILIHEMAHVFSLTNGFVDEPAPLGAAYLYFDSLGIASHASCRSSELFADILQLSVVGASANRGQGDAILGYWERCNRDYQVGHADPLTEEALTVVRSALSGQMPQWFVDTYHDSNGNADLEQLWSDIKSMKRGKGARSVVAYRLRDQFGGYCGNPQVAAVLDIESSSERESDDEIRNPWRNGGCVPEAPGALRTVLGNNQLELSWEAPVFDGGSRIRGYAVEWKSGDEDYHESRRTVLDDPSSHSHTVTGLTEGVEHTFRVTAFNVFGDGEYTAVTISNSPATGLPTISGTALVGETLTASTSGIADEDGLSNPTYSYRWIRNDGATDSYIQDATSSTYTLTDTAAGKTIKVRVSFADDKGNGETLTSDATAVVAATVPGVPEHVRVTPHDSQALDVSWEAPASDGGSAVTGYKVQWKKATGSWDTPEDVSEAVVTGSTHTIPGLTEGTAYSVRVLASNEVGDGSASAEQAGTPRETTPPSLSTATVNGAILTLAYDEALDENSVPASETFSVTAGDVTTTVDSVSISDSSVTLTLSSAVTKDVAVTVSYAVPTGLTTARIKDLAGNAAPALSSQAVVNYTGQSADYNSAQWSATMTVGVSNGVYGYESFWFKMGTLSDNTITLDGSVYTLYSLRHSNSGSPYVLLDQALSSSFLLLLDGVEFASDDASTLNGATGYVYLWSRGDLSWSYGEEVNVSLVLVDEEEQAENTPPTGLPTITGTAQVGQMLMADVSGISDTDGLDNVDYSYQWLADDTDIAGATDSTYTPSVSDVGKTVKVRVSFTDDADNQETLTSTATMAVDAKPNTAPTGLPTITGTAQVDETLTADTSGITDEDGLTNVTFEYQWMAGGTDIDGATSSSYLLTSTEQGQTIQVGVTFADDADNEETLTSEATVPVAAAPNREATGSPTISGTPQVGETLTAETSAIADENGLAGVSYSYQWIRSDNGTDADIAGQTDSTYALVAADQGKTIKVRVSFTDDANNEETLTSAATGVVSQSGKPVADGATPVWSADMLVVEYTSVSIGAATADLFSNVGGSASLHIKSLWSYTLNRDLRLEFEEGVPGAADLTLQVGDLKLPFPAGSSGQSSFKWTDVDVDWEDGQTISVRIVPTSATVTPQPNTLATGGPTISGTAQVGETLTALTNGITDSDGLTNVSYSYQWIRSDGNTDTDIAEETDSTYTLVPADEGKTIKVRVSFTDDADNAETLTSAATRVVEAKPNSPASGAPTIDGTAQVGETLTALTNGITDSDGLTNVSYSYQWIRSDNGTDADMAGQTDSTYALVAADQGKTIKVRVSFTDDADHEEALTGNATTAVAAAPNRQATGLPTITGTPQVDETLTADVSGITDEDGLTNVTFEYQWMAGGTDIAGATGSSYTLTASEQGLTIQLRLRFTDDADNEETLTSAATAPVAAAPNREATGSPTISGTPQVDQTLTADTSSIDDDDGLTNVSYRYQWVAGGSDIDGATGSSYELTYNEQGHTIQVRVAFTDDADNEESLTSEATVAVAAAPNREATGKPSITGTPQVEQTLTADTANIADQDGLTGVSYRYQWTAGGLDIDGATSSTFTLTASEQGKTIQIRVAFTDDRGNSESLTSEPTGAVAAKPTPLTATFTNVPTSHSGSGTTFTFDLVFSENFPLSYITLRDHAFTEDDDGPVTKAQRKVQGSNQTWTITVEPRGNGAITITLPATTDCNDAGAICTGDGRKLSNSLSFTVSGPGG